MSPTAEPAGRSRRTGRPGAGQTACPCPSPPIGCIPRLAAQASRFACASSGVRQSGSAGLLHRLSAPLCLRVYTPQVRPSEMPSLTKYTVPRASRYIGPTITLSVPSALPTRRSSSVSTPAGVQPWFDPARPQDPRCRASMPATAVWSWTGLLSRSLLVCSCGQFSGRLFESRSECWAPHGVVVAVRLAQ